jgi:hypothetical protein
MEGNGLSPADLMAMMNNGNANWNNNPFLWLIFLAMMGNGNFGGWGNNGSAATQGAITRAELTDGLNNQTVLNDFRNVEQGISQANASIAQNLNSGFSGIQQQLCQGFSGVNSNINQSTNAQINALNAGVNNLQSAITQGGFNNQMGFCNVSNAIEGLKYTMTQNCCDLKTAMHAEGELTRGLMLQDTIQELRDKLAEKSALVAESNQTQTILNALGRYYPAGQIGNW